MANASRPPDEVLGTAAVAQMTFFGKLLVGTIQTFGDDSPVCLTPVACFCSEDEMFQILPIFILEEDYPIIPVLPHRPHAEARRRRLQVSLCLGGNKPSLRQRHRKQAGGANQKEAYTRTFPVTF